MTSVAASHEHHEAPSGGAAVAPARLPAPAGSAPRGCRALFAGIGFGIVVLFRWWGGYEPPISDRDVS